MLLVRGLALVDEEPDDGSGVGAIGNALGDVIGVWLSSTMMLLSDVCMYELSALGRGVLVAAGGFFCRYLFTFSMTSGSCRSTSSGSVLNESEK